ncbi:MAG TPA: hypothetical protein VG943_09810 [Caulobacterales bacterium]|nr:hypothetical protein [Caulobacterales bacterium]
MRRALHIIAAIIIVILVVGLYKAKSDASKARAHVHALERQIADTQADMRALRAEIARLESPEHIAELAAQHTALQPGRAGQALPERAIDTALPPPQMRRASP